VITASVVVVGGGFAGFSAARTLERLLPPEAADLTLVSATDHLCYGPLLPEVAAGRLDPRRIAVPLHARLHRTASCRRRWRTSTSTSAP
jgi:NADH:quinone reductase (non-electrogenic)